VRRYLVLLVVAVAVGLVGMVVSRRAACTPPPEEAPAEKPVVALDLVVTNGRVAPEMSSVPKDHLVRLTVTNRDRGELALVLMGYQDRFLIRVPADSTWRGEFVADRPGDEFAWMLAGEPIGRLQVTGSHLEEGHR
jgi:hypothetical protein